MGVAAVAMTTGGAAYAAFPGFGNNPLGPEYLITFSDSGVTTMLNPVYTTNPGPYDGSDDTYFGVINNSSSAITHFVLSSATLDIAGFDGDGINASSYLNIPNNPSDTSGYGGPNAFFTNIAANLQVIDELHHPDCGQWRHGYLLARRAGSPEQHRGGHSGTLNLGDDAARICRYGLRRLSQGRDEKGSLGRLIQST